MPAVASSMRQNQNLLHRLSHKRKTVNRKDRPASGQHSQESKSKPARFLPAILKLKISCPSFYPLLNTTCLLEIFLTAGIQPNRRYTGIMDFIPSTRLTSRTHVYSGEMRSSSFPDRMPQVNLAFVASMDSTDFSLFRQLPYFLCSSSQGAICERSFLHTFSFSTGYPCISFS